MGQVENINEALQEGVRCDLGYEEWVVALLSSIATSLAIIADLSVEEHND